MGTRANGVRTSAPSKMQQVRMIETTTALLGLGVFSSTARDVSRYGLFAVSFFIQRLAADTNVSFAVQASDDGITWRTQTTATLSVTAATTVANSNFSNVTVRKFMRVVATNNTANALAATEITTTLKPVS